METRGAPWTWVFLPVWPNNDVDGCQLSTRSTCDVPATCHGGHHDPSTNIVPYGASSVLRHGTPGFLVTFLVYLHSGARHFVPVIAMPPTGTVRRRSLVYPRRRRRAIRLGHTRWRKVPPSHTMSRRSCQETIPQAKQRQSNGILIWALRCERVMADNTHSASSIVTRWLGELFKPTTRC